MRTCLLHGGQEADRKRGRERGEERLKEWERTHIHIAGEREMG